MVRTIQTTDTNDIALDDDNQHILIADGADSVRSRVSARLQTIRGEWFLQPFIGIPYLDSEFEIHGSTALLLSTIRAELERIEDVAKANITTFDYDAQTRTISLNATIETDEGIIITLSPTEVTQTSAQSDLLSMRVSLTGTVVDNDLVLESEVSAELERYADNFKSKDLRYMYEWRNDSNVWTLIHANYSGSTTDKYTVESPDTGKYRVSVAYVPSGKIVISGTYSHG